MFILCRTFDVNFTYLCMHIHSLAVTSARFSSGWASATVGQTARSAARVSTSTKPPTALRPACCSPTRWTLILWWARTAWQCIRLATGKLGIATRRNTSFSAGKVWCILFSNNTHFCGYLKNNARQYSLNWSTWFKINWNCEWGSKSVFLFMCFKFDNICYIKLHTTKQQHFNVRSTSQRVFVSIRRTINSNNISTWI